MTWTEPVVIRILFIIIGIIGNKLPNEIRDEIRALDIHIRVNSKGESRNDY